MRQAGDRIPGPGATVPRKPAPRRRTRKPPAEPFGPLKTPGFQQAQRKASQCTQRAETRLSEPVLPSFPLLKHYTPAQKRAIVGAHSKAIQKQRQPGESAMDTVRRLRATGDAQTRQSIEVLRRALTITSKQRKAAQQRYARQPQAKPGPKPKRSAVGGALAPLGTAENFLLSPEHNAIAAMHPGKIGGFYGSRLWGDAVSIPRNTVLSAYLTGRAGVKAAQGDTGPAKELAHQFVHHDPIALAVQGKFKQAAIEAGNHPLNTALELGGVRAGGASLARLTGTSLEREARTLPGTALVEERRAGHPLSKIAQEKLDARRARKYEEHTARGRKLEAQGEDAAAEEQFQKAGRHPGMVSDQYIEHRADVSEGMSQPGRRRGRTEVSRAYRGKGRKQDGMIVPVGEGGHVEREIATGTVPAKVMENGRVDVADLRARLEKRADRLEAEQKGLEGWRLNRNRKTVTQIRKALRVPDAQLERVAEQAHASARYTNALEAKALRRGMRDPDEALTARYKDYAQHNMGARLGLTSEEQAAWEAKWQAQREEAMREGRPPGPPPPKPRKHLVVDEHPGGDRGGEIQRLKAENGKIEMRVETETARARKANGNGAHREGAQAAQYVQLAEQRIADNNGRIATLEKANGTGKRVVAINHHDIEADMRARGHDPANVSFVTQAPRGLRGAFNTRWYPRKGLGTDRTKTMEATRLGLYDTHPKSLHENAGRLQQAIAADENFVHGVQQVMLTTPDHPDGAFATPAKAREAIEAMKYTKDGERIPGIPEMRVIRLVPFGTDKARANLHYMLDHGDEEGFVTRGGVTHHPISEAIRSAVDENAADGPGPYGVVPDAWARRIEAHADVYKSSSPALRALTSMFRHTVLPLSLPWLIGNVTEAALRAVIQDPRLIKNIRTFRAVYQALKKVDPDEAGRLHDILGTGHFGMAEASNVHTSLEQFAGRRYEPVARAFAQLRSRPGVGTAMDAYRAWTHWVFEGVNAHLEIPFKEAMAGHHLRKVLGPEAEANSAEALAEALRGKKGTNAQVRLADDVRRAYGQYEAFGPTARKYITLYSPFMAWSINAIKFLGQVLPKDHPALTAAIAAADRATEQWRKDNGLQEGEKGAVPAFLMGSIPLPGGGHLRIARYTPFGFFSDPGGSIAGMVLPQYSGAIAGLQGQKWTGEPLSHDGVTEGQKFGYAGTQLLESHIPFIGLIQGIVGRGASATHPASIPKSLAGYENPFKTTGAKKKGHGGLGPAVGGKGQGSSTGGVDWSKVDWGAGGGGNIDWSKVDWGATK